MEINSLMENELINNLFISLEISLILAVLITMILTIIEKSKRNKTKDKNKNNKLFEKVFIFMSILLIVNSVSYTFSISNNRKQNITDFISCTEKFLGEKITSDLTDEEILNFLYNGDPIIIETESVQTIKFVTNSDNDSVIEDSKNSNNTNNDNSINKSNQYEEKEAVVTYKYILINNNNYVEFYKEKYENYFQKIFREVK